MYMYVFPAGCTYIYTITIYIYIYMCPCHEFSFQGSHPMCVCIFLKALISFRAPVEEWLSGTPFWERKSVTWYVTTAAFEAIMFRSVYVIPFQVNLV